MDIFSLSDAELISRTIALSRSERETTVELVEHLAEIDRRGLPRNRHETSLFEFCVYTLRYSEDAAYRRIRAARAIKKFPPISILFREGKLTLETISQLHPFLGDPDAAVLVKSCIGLRKWQVQALLAGRQPEAAKRDVIRYCGPAPATARAAPDDAPLIEAVSSALPSASAPSSVPSPFSAPSGPPAPLPLPPHAAVPVHAVRVSFSAGAEFHKLLRRAQSLLRHKYPDGRLEGVLTDALTALLRRKDPGVRWAPARAGPRKSPACPAAPGP